MEMSGIWSSSRASSDQQTERPSSSLWMLQSWRPCPRSPAPFWTCRTQAAPCDVQSKNILQQSGVAGWNQAVEPAGESMPERESTAPSSGGLLFYFSVAINIKWKDGVLGQFRVGFCTLNTHLPRKRKLLKDRKFYFLIILQ